MKTKHLILGLATLAFVTTSCKNDKSQKKDQAADSIQEVENDSVELKESNQEVYVAELSALNSDITKSETHGEAKFEVKNDSIYITIDVKDAPANMEHWQHFHGFVDGSEATCVTQDADQNDDGIIDVTETEEASGTTMVPFNKLPVKMDVGADTYPKADEDGNYHYEAVVSKDDLEKAFADAFDGDHLDLDKRVLYIHGVDTDLPSTVKSIVDIPAKVTIPIACGKIVRQ